MSKRTPKQKPEAEAPKPLLSRSQIIGALVGVAVLFVGAVILTLVRSNSSGSGVLPAPTPYTIGNVLYCTGSPPPFVQALGFGELMALDTRGRIVKGLALHELDANGEITRSYEHPSWSSAGYLGPYESDGMGNIYLAPMPFISLLDNPPDKANIIYRVGREDGVMSPFMELPAEATLTPESIYGLTDLAYDCDTNSLYASTVMGSTYEQVAGRIFQIDLTSGAIKSTLENLDAIGLGIFNSVNGKRLYIGLARVPEVYSVALAEDGKLTGDLKPQVSLRNLGYHRDERARSIVFQGQDRLQITTVQFDFNLVAPTETRQTMYEYHYNVDQDTWELVGVQPVNE
jgi:hypothetical protein